jgi:hypothetical protein
MLKALKICATPRHGNEILFNKHLSFNSMSSNFLMFTVPRYTVFKKQKHSKSVSKVVELPAFDSRQSEVYFILRIALLDRRLCPAST